MSNDTILLITLFFCHFIADFTPASTSWMLKAKRFGTPLFPIYLHAKVHAVLMAAPLLYFIGYGDKWAYLVILQIVSHFGIDVLKGRINFYFASVQDPANKWHWIVFGADQFLHAVVIILMAEIAL